MRLHTIVTCVNYSDFLRLTLPHNRAILPKMTVVTSPGDLQTRELCEQSDVDIFVTDCWTRGGAVFNKARALDLALDHAQLAGEDWVLVMDADILLPVEVKEAFTDIHPDCLYSLHRHMCRTPNEWELFVATRDAGELEVDTQRIINGKVWGHRPTSNPAGLLGYFQLWHPASHFQRFGSFPTAEKYDVEFALHWASEDRHFLPDLAAIHLGLEKQNWRGRISDLWHDASPFPAGAPFVFSTETKAVEPTAATNEVRPSVDSPPISAAIPYGDCLYLHTENGDGICSHPQVRSAGQLVGPSICLSCRHAKPSLETADGRTLLATPITRQHAPSSFTWAVGVTTAPRRKATLGQMLTSLASAGWDEPRIFAEPRTPIPEAFAHLPRTQHDEVLGAFPNWYLALTEMVMREPDVDAYLLCQDDVTIAAGLRRYLELELWPAPDVGVVSVYCPSHYAVDRVSGFQVEDRGWGTWGAMAYIFPNRSARALLCDPLVLAHRSAGPHRGIRNIDSVVGDWCRRSGSPYFVHWPSLAQHIGATSTLYPGAGARGRRRAHEAILDLNDLHPTGRFHRRPQSRLVIEPIQGLCNRLRVLLSAMVLAELRGDELALEWKPQWQCPARFEELFAPICDEALPRQFDGGKALHHRGGEHPYTIWEKYVAKEFDLSREEFVERVVQKASLLQPLDIHLQRVDEVMAECTSDQWVGVHIRRTDFSRACGKGKLSGFTVASDDAFAKRMEARLEEHPETVFYLATDNPQTHDHFTQRFSGRIRTADVTFQAPRRVRGRRHVQQRLTSVTDALVDLYCLSRCSHIIGSSGSSFSALAGWINERPVQMV